VPVNLFKKVWQVLRQASVDWREDNASRLAAALAYYAVFSLAPMAVLAVAIAGRVLGEGAAQEEIVRQVETWLQSKEAGDQVRRILDNAQQAGNTGTLIGIGGLIFGATVFFASLQEALNTVWEVQPKKGIPVLGFLKKRAVSFLMIVALGAMLAASLVGSTVAVAVGRYFEELLPMPPGWLQLANGVVSFVLITVLFAAVYRVLPDARIAWSDVWVGAAITSLLFVLGALALAVYFAFTSVGSAYGAAGSLIVISVWIYWTSQIVLFGAEITQVYANRFGKSIRPEEGAEYRPGAHRAREVRERMEGDSFGPEEANIRAPAAEAGSVARSGARVDRGIARAQSAPADPGKVRSRRYRLRSALLYLLTGALLWEGVRRILRRPR
jgi:membrane protein